MIGDQITAWSRSLGRAPYDAVIAALGYEKRSAFIPTLLAPDTRERFACGFGVQHVLSYAENLRDLTEAGYDITEVQDREFRAWVVSILDQLASVSSVHASVAVDISSVSRLRLAILVDCIRTFVRIRRLKVDFLYAPAKYSPPAEDDSPNQHVGPVLPSYAGWTDEPEAPVTAVVGLGYEEDRALGAVERIDPDETWCFLPTSGEAEYTPALLRANEELIASVPEGRLLEYVVESPFDCFTRLESLAFRKSHSSRVVLIPFGPKSFTLCALLVAGVHPEIAVWRVSAGARQVPVQREPTGLVVGISAEAVTEPQTYE
jgi:hypothetical protein